MDVQGVPILLGVERDTFCTFILLAAERDRYTLYVHTTSILLAVERDTTCTSILLAMEEINLAHPYCCCK
jgi:hypothetical protein